MEKVDWGTGRRADRETVGLVDRWTARRVDWLTGRKLDAQAGVFMSFHVKTHYFPPGNQRIWLQIVLDDYSESPLRGNLMVRDSG